MNRILLTAAALFALAASGFAQNKAPVAISPIVDFTEFQNASARSIDLNAVFQDPDLTAAVRMTTTQGIMEVALFDRQRPITAGNFLKYVNTGRYFVTDPVTKSPAPSFIHRSVPGFVIQGGGFLATVDSTNTNIHPTAVATYPPIQNEPGFSNKRGTIAMAKTSDPNSATSQWFINMADNSASLDNPANSGGFAVFGRVLRTGMSVADRIAALPIFNFQSPFDSLPLQNYIPPNAAKRENLVSLPEIVQIPSVNSPLNFSATSDNPAIAEAKISENNLLVSGKGVGSARITVIATDLDGATVTQAFNVNVIAAPGHLANISTRVKVGTDENVLIAGFIVRGGTSKRLIVRGIGQSLVDSGVQSPLADPVIELHDPAGAVIGFNNNWGDNENVQEIIDAGVAPINTLEAAILTTVPSNDTGIAYTAVLKGANRGTGIGVVEAYDLDSGPGSSILNLSTRGRVDVDPNALIGGFFVGGAQSKRVLIRAIGPSLANFGVVGPLADPTIELRDINGNLLDSNNDWQSSPQASEIQASGVAPTNPKESAMVDTLPPSGYTAIVRGVNKTAGIGSVEVYQLP